MTSWLSKGDPDAMEDERLARGGSLSWQLALRRSETFGVGVILRLDWLADLEIFRGTDWCLESMVWIGCGAAAR